MRTSLPFTINHLPPAAAILLLVLFSTVRAQTSGVISGRVVNEEGTALAGITVNLYVAYSPYTSRSPMKTALTGDDGQFRFVQLPRQNYLVKPLAAHGYVPQTTLSTEDEPPRIYRLGQIVNLIMIRGGAIQGRVADTTGRPMIATYVRAFLVRDASGNKFRVPIIVQSQLTDDRGVYRLHGLPPGTYVVASIPTHYTYSLTGVILRVADNNQPPTYHPSGARTAAAEIHVARGGEASGIDIQHRGEGGHGITGKVTNLDGSAVLAASIDVLLSSASAGQLVAKAFPPEMSFMFSGLPDGEYEIAVPNSPGMDIPILAEPRHVTIKGADITGLDLKLSPPASIAGRIAFKASASTCDATTESSLAETIFVVTRGVTSQNTLKVRPFSQTASVLGNGSFFMNGLPPGNYHVALTLPDETWFVTSVTDMQKPANTDTTNSALTDSNLSNAELKLKSGEKVSGIVITVADGAASLRGQVVRSRKGVKLPTRLRIHLIPAEPSAADAVLRYAETTVAGDGAFAFANLAPGKYWLLARTVPNNESPNPLVRSAAWNAVERVRLRKDAKTAKNEIELKACQRVKDYVLRF